MLSRKVSAVAMVLTSAAFVVGLAIADDKSKTHKAMEKIRDKETAIKKYTKTAANFKKNQKEVVSAAEELAKLGKEIRDETDASKEAKKPQEKWTEYMDDFVKKSEDFAKLAGKDDAEQASVKKAYSKVSASCSACHKDFRKDDE